MTDGFSLNDTRVNVSNQSSGKMNFRSTFASKDRITPVPSEIERFLRGVGIP